MTRYWTSAWEPTILRHFSHLLRHSRPTLCNKSCVTSPHDTLIFLFQLFKILWPCGVNFTLKEPQRKKSHGVKSGLNCSQRVKVARSSDLTPCDFFLWGSLRVKFTPHGHKILKSWNKKLEYHVD